MTLSYSSSSAIDSLLQTVFELYPTQFTPASTDGLMTILPLAFLMTWTCLLLLLDAFLFNQRKHWTAILAAVGLLIALGLTLVKAAPCMASPLSPSGNTLPCSLPETAFNGMATMDGFAIFLHILFLCSGLAAILLAYDYLKRMNIERGEFYVLLLFSIGGMLMMSMASDLIMVFISLEWLSIPLYILAAFAHPRLDSEEAGLKYFLLGVYAGGFVVYGIALVYGATGSTTLEGIVKAAGANPGLMTIGAALILVGLGFKVSAVPFHMWTPDVYHGAPSAVSAFMSVAAKAGGFAALLRVFVAAFPSLAADLSPILWALAVMTMLLGNLIAIAQTNIKRMLAYSSIAHAGYILMALVTFGQPGMANESVAAALFYLATYAVTGFGAWAVVIALEKAEEQQKSTPFDERRGLALEDYVGLGRRRPALAAAMAVFMLSFTGVPPTLGFIGKFYLFRVALEGGQTWLAIIGVLTSLISAYYYLRIIMLMYMSDAPSQDHAAPAPRQTDYTCLFAYVSAVAVIVLSLFAAPLLRWAAQAMLAVY